MVQSRWRSSFVRFKSQKCLDLSVASTRARSDPVVRKCVRDIGLSFIPRRRITPSGATPSPLGDEEGRGLSLASPCYIYISICISRTWANERASSAALENARDVCHFYLLCGRGARFFSGTKCHVESRVSLSSVTEDRYRLQGEGADPAKADRRLLLRDALITRIKVRFLS